MNSKSRFSLHQFSLVFQAIVLGLAVSACTPGTLAKKLSFEESGPEAALVYYQGISRLPPADLARERNVLTALPQVPFTQVRLAMLLGQTRSTQDLGKAVSLLEGLLKSGDSAAAPFHPLARLLADNYLERIRLESQLDKQGVQLKESQRKAAELQEKLTRLTNIEKNLIQRPRGVAPDGAGR